MIAAVQNALLQISAGHAWRDSERLECLRRYSAGYGKMMIALVTRDRIACRTPVETIDRYGRGPGQVRSANATTSSECPIP